MQLLRAHRHPPRHVFSSHDDRSSLSSEPFAQGGSDEVSSRHDAQLLAGRTVPADPYAAWLEQREADGAGSVNRRAAAALWP
jgi:hypothetical protein